DAAGKSWADYTMLGFNHNWIVVGFNSLSVGSNSPLGGELFAFDKSALYLGPAQAPFVRFTNSKFDSLVPAITYDDAINPLYLLQVYNSKSGAIQLSELVGTPSAPSLQVGLGPSSGLTLGTNAWSPTGPNAPQLGSSVRIDTDDDRIQ